jgi:cytochrome d ubiquinol oxidase subunit II
MSWAITLDLPVIFGLVSALAIGMYVILDGFDLGVGIIFPFAPRSADREMMMRSLAPIWDGNETWLVLGGMVLFAAFPGAFAILMPAFYVPLALMLFGLVLRGIALEFRPQGGGLQVAWSAAFAFGSTLAGFCQGAVLGALVSERISIADGRFAGGPFEWLSLFSIITGLGVVAAYAVLGAAWLIWKTDGGTQTYAREIARPALVGTGAAIAIVSISTPLTLPDVAARWFSMPEFLYLCPLPIVAALAWLATWRALWHRKEWHAFVFAILLFLSALGGLGVSIWPNVIPGHMSIWTASSEPRTQAIVALGLLLTLPFVLAYTVYSYWVFRGKASVSY